jgi:hypothetical protein
MTFKRIGVVNAVDVLFRGMIDGSMHVSVVAKLAIAEPFIRAHGRAALDVLEYMRLQR